ncbi:hypothetical protein ACFSM5_13445 [Lacibacterium aquatile]|uniref:PRC-barrel domain-containing protein n=1 Tax=Lacibacterium aquatile TaxID=1168082 RepID=A0ABW5DWT9_9PROT
MYKNLMIAATGVTLMLAPALATAQTAPAPSTTPAPATPGTTVTPAPAPSMSAPSAATPADPLEGKDVVNAAGEKIGEVEKSSTATLIVSVGGFLGIGDRQVEVPRDRVSISGTGDDTKVMTSMTEDELKALPEYKNPS